MTGRLSWFDAEKLLPGERIEREAHAELLTREPPYRWYGSLLMTNLRIFFLPEISNALIGSAAFWIDDVVGVARTGRHRIHVTAATSSVSFALTGSPLPARDRAPAWVRRVDALKAARPPVELFEERRRRAG
jgi:hypothetical protein